MSFELRVSFLLLALNLTQLNPVSPQSHPTSSTPDILQSSRLNSPQSPTQSSDEETIRALTEKYALAIAASDLDSVRQFWNPQSPNMGSRIGLYQSYFSNSRLELTSLKTPRVEITGEKAVSYLTTDERLLDKKTGSVLTERDQFHGAARSIEWIKTGAGWKIERESSLQEELAAKLEDANSEDARRELLEKESALVTDVLVRALIERSNRNRMRMSFDSASRSLRIAQTVAEKIGDQAGLAKSWHYMAMIYDIQENLEQGLQYQQRALGLYESAGNKLGEAIVLINLSHNYHELGEFRKAFECAYKALRLSEELNHRSATARALSEMAHVYTYQNNSQQAVACYERAMAILQELGDKIQIAIMRLGIVEQNVVLGNYDRALEIYREILEQTEAHGDPVGGALIRTAIGNIYTRQGRHEDAMDYYRKSLKASEAANFKLSAAHTLISMSEVYLAESKYAEALTFAEQALSLSRQLDDQFPLHFALTAIGHCQLGLGRHAEARRAFVEAISIIEELRAHSAGGVEERQRHFESKLGAYYGMIRLLAQENQPKEALVYAESAKARALLDVLRQGRVSIQKAMTREEQEKERQLKSELTRLNTELARVTQSGRQNEGRVGEIKPLLEKARLNYEAFQNSLYAERPELKAQRGEAPVINAQELTVLLPDATSALLEYAVTDDQTYLFAITKAPGKADVDLRVYTLPIKRDELTRRTEAFRLQLAGRDLGFRASAAGLYDLLLKPAQAQLRGKTNLIIVPDDILWDLPFQALLANPNRFLIENAAIAYAPSLTSLREMMKRRRDQRGGDASTPLLAMGNPLLGKETIKRATLVTRDEKFDPLPEAEQEVKGLSRMYGTSRSKVYVGPEAREDRAKAEAGQARILHFATHAILNNASPMYSHLALAPGGANEDGLLEAWELMQLDLKADLVVLSACETARGHASAGEGIIGLT